MLIEDSLLRAEMEALREHCHQLHDENAVLRDDVAMWKKMFLDANDEKTRLEGILAELQAKEAERYRLPNMMELPTGNTTITRG